MATRPSARVVVAHPRYHASVTLSETTRRALADDLDPENSDAAARARR